MEYKEWYIAVTEDCDENKGGYYCEIYRKSDTNHDNLIDYFCIHKEELEQNNNIEFWIRKYINNNKNLLDEQGEQIYYIIALVDSYSRKVEKMLAINKKHSIREFQNEINRVKNKFEEEILEYGDDWAIISENISDEFDWFELCYYADNFLEF